MPDNLAPIQSHLRSRIEEAIDRYGNQVQSSVDSADSTLNAASRIARIRASTREVQNAIGQVGDGYIEAIRSLPEGPQEVATVFFEISLKTVQTFIENIWVMTVELIRSAAEAIWSTISGLFTEARIILRAISA